MEYELIYSKRRTLGITVRDRRVIVRAPRGLPKFEIEKLIDKHSHWIKKRLEIEEANRSRFESLGEKSIMELRHKARIYFTDKTAEIANKMGIKYGRITITSAMKRFGSCSSAGNICFSYRLMLYPEVAREYVIVHELAHILEMNHSPKFYRIVSEYMPDYKERKKLLR